VTGGALTTQYMFARPDMVAAISAEGSENPSAWKDMTLTEIDAPIRIGRATVLSAHYRMPFGNRSCKRMAMLKSGPGTCNGTRGEDAE
jgi:hypothetical protein